MKKKFVSLLLTALLCLTSLVPAFAAEEIGSGSTVAGKLEQAESFMYGAVQTGSLVGRVDKLEGDLYGQQSSGSVMSRVDRVFNRLEGAPHNGQLSLATVMNVIEWQFSDRMSTDAATTRVGALETQIFGTQYTHDSMTSRISRLTKAAFPSGSLTSSSVVLPKDSLIKVKFMQDISSKENQAGDVIDFVVDDNIYVGDALVLPKGAKGVGRIAKIVQPRIFGRDARIDLDFSHVVAVNDGAVPVIMGDLAKQQAKTAAGAAGASIGGMVLFGPVGIVGGAFVKGSSVVIPAGSNTYVQVKEDTTVDGVILAGNTAGGQQLDGSNSAEEATVAQPAPRVEAGTDKKAPAEKSAEEAPAKEPAAEDKNDSGVSLDETETDTPGHTEKEPAGDNQADTETEAAIKADQAKDNSKKDSASEPLLDEDDGSAYDSANSNV